MLAVALAFMMICGSVPAGAVTLVKKVTSQTELTEAINGNYRKIVIQTTETVSFSIPECSSNAKLYVRAGKSSFVNDGAFKGIYVYNAASYTENASNNKIRVSDKDLDFNVSGQGSVKSLSFVKKKARNKLTNNGRISSLKMAAKADLDVINNGRLNNINIYKGGNLNLGGSSTRTTKVYVRPKAEDTVITTSKTIKTFLYANTNITFNEGSEASVVTFRKAIEAYSFTNNTKDGIGVFYAEGTRGTVEVGKSMVRVMEVASNNGSQNTDNKNNSGQGSSSQGSSTNGTGTAGYSSGGSYSNGSYTQPTGTGQSSGTGNNGQSGSSSTGNGGQSGTGNGQSSGSGNSGQSSGTGNGGQSGAGGQSSGNGSSGGAADNSIVYKFYAGDVHNYTKEYGDGEVLDCSQILTEEPYSSQLLKIKPVSSRPLVSGTTVTWSLDNEQTAKIYKTYENGEVRWW